MGDNSDDDKPKQPTVGAFIDAVVEWGRRISNRLGALVFTAALLGLVLWRALGSTLPVWLVACVVLPFVLMLCWVVIVLTVRSPHDLLQD